MTIIKRVLLAMLALAAFLAMEVVVIHYSIQYQQKWDARNLSAVQASLNFNSYENYNQLEQFLSKQCYASALAMAKFHKEDSLSSLKYGLRMANDRSLEQYIKERDSSVLTRPVDNLPLSIAIPSCVPQKR